MTDTDEAKREYYQANHSKNAVPISNPFVICEECAKYRHFPNNGGSCTCKCHLEANLNNSTERFDK